MKRFLVLPVWCICTFFYGKAQDIRNNPESNHGNKFEQLGTTLPTPNAYRTASGAPGPAYWQQRVDYNIRCELDETKQILTGSETVTYFNNSPDPLEYLWFQLDENQHSSINNANYQLSTTIPQQLSLGQVKKWEQDKTDNGYGVNITSLTDAAGKDLPYHINRTMMRVDLPATLKPGEQFVVKISWNYRITNRMESGGRGGYEYFPEDGNYLFTMTQWYPRLCVYSDFEGWQNHQFANKEFALSFGNFDVAFTVPADHVVGATGECQNYAENLNPTQLTRWKNAQTAKEPIEIITLAEAKKAERTKSKEKKTWKFRAENVRDFAWTSSRKFVWDAMPTYIDGKKIMCMSFYGKEAYPLYSKYSTKVVAHTLKVYSHHTIPYPYPVAQSVEASNGMEYPMICFNFGRADRNGRYSDAVKWGMIGVIIHEVGHNFFPMIINNDERQWSWMDEGLNSFVEYIAEQAWDTTFPSRRGPARTIVKYMSSPKEALEPIMTNVDNILQFGNNAYGKVAAAMNILRETILGREAFDHAFRTYARRWAFKHPTPADLFRTLEDASGEDLDWFWRGWFYGTDPCDIAIEDVKYYQVDPSARNNKDKEQKDAAEKHFYELALTNKGGLVMPLIIQWTFTDGTTETDRIPAQIWRLNENRLSKVFMKDKKVTAIQLDPLQETADIDETNNRWTEFPESSMVPLRTD